MEHPLTVAEGETRTCSSCGQLSPASASWCEACGHDLDAEPKPVCVACGETAVEPDGYCHSCGHRQPGPRDHVETEDGSVVAISDRGQRHHHNEDAVAVVEVGSDAAVLVACDGVSSTPGSAQVSLAAAEAVARVLADAVEEPDGPSDPDDAADGPVGAVPDAALHAAIDAAQAGAKTATAAIDVDEFNPPSTTVVAAVARRIADQIAVSVVWLGDSRVYWVDGDDGHVLTTDHEINGALTRWVGVDATDHHAQTVHRRFAHTGAAELLVCTDGMWRYFDPTLGEPAAGLVTRLKADGLRGLDLVRALVEYANDRGGHDNISVAHWSPGSSDEIGGTTVEPSDEASPTVDQPDDRADEDPPKEPQT